MEFTSFSLFLIMFPPEFVRKLSFRLISNFLPWSPHFSKVLQDGLRLLLHFFHKGNHDHSLTLYFLHESLKFIKIIREKNTHIHIICTPSFHLFNRVVGWMRPYYRTGEFIRFSIYSTRVGTLPSRVVSRASDLESEDSTIVLLLNFGGILQQKCVPPWNMHNYIKTNKKMYRFSKTCVPHWNMHNNIKIYMCRFS